MDKPNIAVSGTKHTVTTPNGRIIHERCISKPLNNFNQDCNNNRGTGPRGPEGRFTKSPSKTRRTYILESDNESEPTPPENIYETTPDQTDNTTVKKGHSAEANQYRNGNGRIQAHHTAHRGVQTKTPARSP